jgi:FkbM family methyltransferase
MLTVKFEDQVCYFDSAGTNFDNPGVIDACLIRGIFYEQEFLKYIASLEIRGVYVDVGACVGTHSVFFAMCCPADHVYAFEPRAGHRARIERTLQLNNLLGKVTVSQWALSDTGGKVSMTLDGRDHKLATERLDNLIHGPVAVIKIDVEGMESKVLAGATNLLRRHRPRVFAEAHTSEDYERIRECLRPLGYKATGRVFNVSPTYEFVVPSSPWALMTMRYHRQTLRLLRRTLPHGMRPLVRRARRAFRRAVGRSAVG